uniref:Uncharacterized protein n=1 Tax=viral metagenome TaxID=1070528 RepID=A0A6C0C819_9ZZZZ
MSRLSGGWNLDNGTFIFVSHMHNFLNNLPKNGDSAKNVNPNELIFSSDVIGGGLPRTLRDLLKIVPSKYITYSVYVNANGSVSNHDCWQYNFLVILGYTGNNVDGTVSVARTDWKPDSGGPISSFGGETYEFDKQSWYKLYSGSKMLDKITSGNRVQLGSGSTCRFYPFGGWSEARVSVLFFVTVDVREYCTESDNIGNDFCFTMMNDYLGQKEKRGKMEPSIAGYLLNYCSRNVADLTSASSRNQQICACNMPDSAYTKYDLDKNISGIRTPCYLDDCLRSNFKPGNFNDCPSPACLNLLSIDRSPIGGNLSIDQSSQCLNITKNNDDDTNPSLIVEKSFWEKNKIIIIVVIVIIILLIIGAGVYFATSD